MPEEINTLTRTRIPDHSLDTNTVMETRFIFGTQCTVAMLAAGDRKLVV